MDRQSVSHSIDNASTVNSAPNDTGLCGAEPENAFDIVSDKTFRLLILYLTIGINIVGTILVLIWMISKKRLTCNLRALSRVDALILNLTLADALVILLAVFPQVVWEHVEKAWLAGPVVCRLVKFCQSLAIMASNYSLIVIAVDRHQAVRAPLKKQITVSRLAGIGWGMATVLSLPVLFMYQINTRDGMQFCDSVLRDKPRIHRQIWMTYISVVVFFIPLFLLIICYTRIFMKLYHKARENSMRPRSGDGLLQSTPSASFPRAKSKTLKMTCVIIAVFIFCALPFFTIEMIMTYGHFCVLSPKIYALIGGMAAFNSAMNPFVFLGFNINKVSPNRGKPSSCYNDGRYQVNGKSAGKTGSVDSTNTYHKKLLMLEKQDTMVCDLDLDTKL